MAEHDEPGAATATSMPAPDRCDIDPGKTPDLVALAAVMEVCPRRAEERRVQRARLLLVATRGELARVTPTLTDPELSALARLLLRDAGPTTALAIEPLETARFVPVDQDVLARARGAWAMLGDTSDDTDDRTRAEAWLAEAHFAAIASLGVPRDEPAPPFVRLIGARALDHGRRFVMRWVQRRVEGTEAALRRVEAEMERLVRWFDEDPGFGDPPEVAWAIELARDHLRTASSRARRSRARLGKALPTTPATSERELPWLGELERRVAAGMIPRALARGRMALSALPAGERESGLLAIALVLRRWGVDPDRLARGAGDPLRILRDDLGERLDDDDERAAGEQDTLSALVPEVIVEPTPRRVITPSWPEADAVAATLVVHLRAYGEDPLDVVSSRRAQTLARARPDAVARAFDLAADDPSLARWRPWLHAWSSAHVGRPPSRSAEVDLARRPAADGSGSSISDARRHRLRFADASHDAIEGAGRR